MKQRVWKIRRVAIVVLLLAFIPFYLAEQETERVVGEETACETSQILEGGSGELCEEERNHLYTWLLFGAIGLGVGLFVLAWILDDESKGERAATGTHGGDRRGQIAHGGENRRMGTDEDQ